MDPKAAKAYILSRLRNELPAARTYHSLEHTLDVYASAIGIAEQEGVTGEELVLLKVAALYHDSGFTVQDHEHERAGCVIAQEKLPGVLVQAALALQLSVPAVHSLTSEQVTPLPV